MQLECEAILEIARQARMDFEAGAVARPLLANLYSNYSPNVGNVSTFLEQAAALFPAANCGITSQYLRQILQAGENVRAWPEKASQPFRTYDGQNHTFLLLGSLVADITADQFDTADRPSTSDRCKTRG